MTATVVITTKNRKDDLRSAIQSALAQTARPEVLVVDDGSTDGTTAMVRKEFPAVRIERVEQSLGYIVQRNLAAGIATGDVVFSIDDDAVFSTPDVVTQSLAEFANPRVGAVAIPVIDVKKSPDIYQRAPHIDGIYATFTYVGTAHALRRELFLRLGRYREYLFHQGEERDYCIRMLAAGYVVRMGSADPIHHFESPRRDFRRMDLYGRRNDVLFAWYNVPWSTLPIHLAGTTLNGLRYGIQCGRLWRMAQGIAYGYGAILHELFHRRPVNLKVYRLAQLLKTRAAVPLADIESFLPGVPTG